jgi:hypothetical protein
LVLDAFGISANRVQLPTLLSHTTKRMFRSLLFVVAASLFTDASVSLRASLVRRATPVPRLPGPPVRKDLVILPYESPDVLTVRLRRQALADSLKEGPLLIGDLVIPLPPPVKTCPVVSNQSKGVQLA